MPIWLRKLFSQKYFFKSILLIFFSNVVCFIGQNLVFLLSSFLLQIFVGSLMPILD